MTPASRSRPTLALPVLFVGVAAVLWFFMFSPWTKGLSNFWLTMSLAALILTSCVAIANKQIILTAVKQTSPKQLLLAVAIASTLWAVFWVGDKISSLLFDFARPEVDSIYHMKSGLPTWAIALLLLCVIGPAEELFWRGYIQHTLSQIFSPNTAFIATTAVYSLIHIWSFNFMLIMAALVAGTLWGLLYRLRPQWLPALIASHALWDTCVFVLFPI